MIPFTFIKNTPTENDTVFKKTYEQKGTGVTREGACRLWGVVGVGSGEAGARGDGHRLAHYTDEGEPMATSCHELRRKQSQPRAHPR